MNVCARRAQSAERSRKSQRIFVQASAEAKLAWTMPSVAENLKEKCQEKGAFIPKILAI